MKKTGLLILMLLVLMVTGSFAKTEATKEQEVSQPVLRWYPSALLPPVKEPYIIYWDFGRPPVFNGSVSNASAGRPREDDAKVSQRGMLPLNWFYGPNNPYAKSEQAFIDNYVSGVRQRTAFGIMVDEWQKPNPKAEPGSGLHADDPYAITGSIKGIIEAKKIDPAFYIAVAWRGEESIEPLTRHGLPDMLMIECYTHVNKRFPKHWGLDMDGIKKRIDRAREYGRIEETICWLGHILKPEQYHEGHVLTVEIIEEQIAEIRKYAPEMPGIAFYSNGDEKLARACDRIARKYFIEPAPEILITAPRFNARLDTDQVTITAKANGKDGRKVVRYRWFIDNRLMAETAEPKWDWQTTDEIAGGHFITVHAVDEAFNRAASQIHVNVTK